MALPGTAFLALWNERAPAREDYDLWHTREHVPERLGIPGMLMGQRYADGDGPLPSYFTLYALSSLTVLESPEYHSVLASPSAWSLSMRPSISDWYRRGCETLISLGGGVGGCLAAVLLAGRPRDDLARTSFARIVELPAFCGLHLGRVTDIPPLPFATSDPPHLPAADAILLVEGFDWPAMAASLPELDQLIHASGYRPLIPWTRYRLAFALENSDRGSMLDLDATRLGLRRIDPGENG